MRGGWFKENGATLVSIVSVLLSAFIVYSSNASLKEKYEEEQKIERQRVAVEYYKWWQKEFNKCAVEYLTVLDGFRARNSMLVVHASENKKLNYNFLKEYYETDQVEKRKLNKAHYNLICLLDNENASHVKFLLFTQALYQQVLKESGLAMRGKKYERDYDLETEYFELINKIRDDSFSNLELLAKFNGLPVPPSPVDNPPKHQ